MRKPKNPHLFTIFLIVFVDLFGFGVILPLLPFIAEQFQANAFTIGLLASVYSLFQFLSGPVLGKLSDRYGRKKLLVISQIGSMIGYLLLGFANALPLLFLSRIIDGITGGNISIAQAYVADVTTPAERAKGMGVLGAAFGLGFILGPAVGGLLSNFGYAAPALFAAAIAFITVLMTMFTLKETVDTTKAQASPRTRLTFQSILAVVKRQPLGLLILVFFLANISFSSLQGNFALWMQATFGYGPRQTGWLFAFIGVTAVFTQLVLIRQLLKRLSEKHVMYIGLLFLGVGMLLISESRVVGMVYAALFCLALGNGLTTPTLQSLASESVRKEEYGETLGILQSSGSLGRVIGPTMAGELYDTFGKNSPYRIAAALMGAVMALLFTRYPKKTVGA